MYFVRDTKTSISGYKRNQTEQFKCVISVPALHFIHCKETNRQYPSGKQTMQGNIKRGILHEIPV